ncbi:MAG: ribbon-helix-helix protein, CopG family [Armatimonadetes bacterium]|nr:ribbon-helix-helix protein, CopG family [Armatimonadota bacterium]
MPSTTIHIPASLLEVVDARARAEGISRNRFILRALERVIDEAENWSPDFLAELSQSMLPEDAGAVDEMVVEIARRRSRKSPPAL